MKNKLFMASLIATMAIPAVIVPMASASDSVNVNVKDITKVVNVIDFTDVSKSNWAYESIMQMKKDGVVNGYPDGSYKPSQSINRSHVAALFTRSLDLTPIRANKHFTDVPVTHPYYDDITNVYRAGIFDGGSGRVFNASSNLTRAQMAKVIVLAFDLKLETGYVFTDVYEDDWAKDYIATLYANGITVGDDGKFKPSDSVSRAQYAAFLHRALNLEDAPKPELDLKPTAPTKPGTVKPTPTPDKPVTKPVLPNIPESKYNTVTGLKYEGAASKNVPKPSGYVTGQHETQRAKEMQNIVNRSAHGEMGGFGLQDVHGTDVIPGVTKVTLKQSLTARAQKGFHITYDQLISAMNWSMETGKVYDGKTFALYFDYRTGTFNYSFARDIN